MYPEIQQLLDLLAVDAEAVEKGRQRQAAVWQGRVPDRVPLLLARSESRQVADRVGPQHLRLCEHQLRGGRPVPEYHDYDHYPLGEQFNDPRKMLIESLWDMIGWARTPSDAQLSIRPNFGVGTVASIFGCGLHAPENDMPWVTQRPAPEAILNIDLDGLDRAGLIPRVIEFIQLARETLREFPDVHVFMPDLQGPLNTAFLLREQAVFQDMLRNPAVYGRLLQVITEVFIRLTRRLKQEIGEPLDGGYHGALFMAGGGARVVDDVSVMLSPAQYQEFALPYVRACLAPFGGGWVHSCGDISHLLQFYLEAPEIRGINFGQPEYYDFASLLPRLAAAGKFCYGGPVRRQGESVRDYLQRTASYLRRVPGRKRTRPGSSGAESALIFIPRYAGADMTEGDWPDPDETLALWAECCQKLGASRGS